MAPTFLHLRELREARGLTQVQVADAVGVRRATISDLETGTTRQDTLELIDRLCEVLTCEPAELIVRPAVEARQATSEPRPPKGRRRGPVEAADGAIESLTNFSEILAEKLPQIKRDQLRPEWAPRLRAVRTILTRIIRECEQGVKRRR